MKFSLSDNLSFMIKTDGTVIAAMPDDEEFSPQQLRDYVAGPPEVVCVTADGFVLFHNKEGKAQGLEPNDVATSVVSSIPQAENVVGRAFLAHPDHIAPHWKKARSRY